MEVVMFENKPNFNFFTSSILCFISETKFTKLLILIFPEINNYKTIVLNQSGVLCSKARVIILNRDVDCFRHKEIPLMGL